MAPRAVSSAAPVFPGPTYDEVYARWALVRDGLLGLRRTLVLSLWGLALVPVYFVTWLFLTVLALLWKEFGKHLGDINTGLVFLLRCVPPLLALYGLGQLLRLTRAPVRDIRAWAWVALIASLPLSVMAGVLYVRQDVSHSLLLIPLALVAGMAVCCFLLNLAKRFEVEKTRLWSLGLAAPPVLLLPVILRAASPLLAAVAALCFALGSLLLLKPLEKMARALDELR